MAERHQGDHVNPVSEEIKALVRGANFAHLATLMRDGSPQVDPVWVDLEGDTILVCTGANSLKAKNTKLDARVGLSVIAADNPYKEAQIRGRVVEQRPDSDFTVIDRVSRKYTGSPFPWRDEPAERLVLVIAVERARSAALPFVHAPA
jgi:PPOX class probable F420-dependent enzyme